MVICKTRTERETEALPSTGPAGDGFGLWQAEWHARGVPTFPVHIVRGAKRPAVRHWAKVELAASSALAARFPGAGALGFAAERAGILVVDVDEPGEEPLRRALDRFGPTPVVVRTASGGSHVYYKRAGEGRLIRPFGPQVAIDVLGEGMVVAPPSRAPAGRYEFVSGGLDALADLPPARNLDLDAPAGPPPHPVGERNRRLWRLAMAEAPACEALDDLVDVVRTANDHHTEVPLDDGEIVKIALSAWNYEQAGRNWIARGREPVRADDAADLLRAGQDGVYGAALLTYLRARWPAPGAQFMIANGLARELAWPVRRLQGARATLLSRGLVALARPASRGAPALYRFPSHAECAGQPSANGLADLLS